MTGLDSFRDARIDQRDGGVQGDPNSSWKTVGDARDLGSGAVLVDQQPYEFYPAEPEGRDGPVCRVGLDTGHGILLLGNRPSPERLGMPNTFGKWVFTEMEDPY